MPKGWSASSLGKIGTWRGGGTPAKSEPRYWQNGTVHWVSPKDMKRLIIDSAQDQITEEAVTNSSTSLIPERSVLMVTRSGILQHTFPVAVNTIRVAVNQDLKAWTPAGGINPLYIAYFLQSRGREILHTCSKDGTTVSSVDFDRLDAYEVQLAPTTEQDRIVSKIAEFLSRIDEGERALEWVQKLVERYRQSVLKAAVTGELTREWREKHKSKLESGEALLSRILKTRCEAWEKSELAKMKAKGQKPTNDLWKKKYKEPVTPDTTNLPVLPEGWVWVSVEQVGLVQLGRQRSPEKQKGISPQKYIRAANITLAGIDFNNVYQMDFDEVEKLTFRLHAGDVLLTEASGSPRHVGRPVVWPKVEGLYCFQNTVIRVQPCVISSEYLFLMRRCARPACRRRESPGRRA